MGLLLTTLSVFIGLLGLIASYLYYLHSNKPTASELATELRESYKTGSNETFSRTDHHVKNVVDAKVANITTWLDNRDDANEQWGYVILNGVFVGTAEIISHFEIPGSPPSIEDIRRHPYYGESIGFTDSNSGTNGFQVDISNRTLILNIELYADSARKGAAAVITTSIILSKIIDDVLYGRIDDPDSIPPFDEFMEEGLGRDDIEYPVVKMENLPETNFSLPQDCEEKVWMLSVIDEIL